MSPRDEDRFRIRPGPPKARQPKFVSRLLREVSKAGSKVGARKSRRPGARLGRGHVAARFAGNATPVAARRVTVKARLVNLRMAGARSTLTHLRYIERDGIGRSGEQGRAYGPQSDEADLSAFEARGRNDRHQFRFIVSAEDAAQIEDLRHYTRSLMGRMESDLGTRLDWVAVDHWDTDNPHTHVVLRGKDDRGQDLVISGDYLAHGMRARASELATEWLGPRTELEIQKSRWREVDQERWTGLDRVLQREAQDGLIRFDQVHKEGANHEQRLPLIGRLQRLERLGLATLHSAGVWSLREDAEEVLRAMGERGDIVRTMQRAIAGADRELSPPGLGAGEQSIVGRVAGKGFVNELDDRGYLVIDGIDGRAHYITLGPGADLGEFPLGGVVEATSSGKGRAVDRNIAGLAVDGVYRTDRHRSLLLEAGDVELGADETITVHVRRLEALRRAGIVERMAEGAWRVPSDLPERGKRLDDIQRGSIAVHLHSHLTLEQQTRAVGATWLDRQLVSGGSGLANIGFGGEVRKALARRTAILVERGLAEQKGQRVVFARNLLATLRARDLHKTAEAISAETGLTYHPVGERHCVSGIYRRSVRTDSGRFALIESGPAFNLVPWRRVLEKRLGQAVVADVRGDRVTWTFGRQRGPTIA